MKYLSILAASVALTACAGQPLTGVQFIGNSAHTPKEVAQCVSQKWADKSQQPVTIQSTLANDKAFDVLSPGQEPGGAAAVIQPASNGSGSWVGIRTGGREYREAVTDITGCL